MDGFTGFKTAAAEVVPDAVAVMDPFHVAALAGDALGPRMRSARDGRTEHAANVVVGKAPVRVELCSHGLEPIPCRVAGRELSCVE